MSSLFSVRVDRSAAGKRGSMGDEGQSSSPEKETTSPERSELETSTADLGERRRSVRAKRDKVSLPIFQPLFYILSARYVSFFHNFSDSLPTWTIRTQYRILPLLY